MQIYKISFLLFFISYFFMSAVISQSILPPELEWSGKSEKLIVNENDEWITPAEQNKFITTPDYRTTLGYLKKLSEATDLISIREIGISAQKRPIILVVASTESKMHDADPSFGEKPNVLIQAGIHSGEIDGKDAGLMLLRDIAFGGKNGLIDKLNLLFIPVLSVDGHENASPYNRPNQRGPENMGWRTNARNLNLNRDYTKLETEGIQAVVKTIVEYDPVFYADIHVTDGADYQYDITYGFKKKNAYSRGISNWLTKQYTPQVNRGLSSNDHFPGPLIFTYKNDDFSTGIIDYYLPLRFSDAYGDARHLPSVLVENHSLKPYKQRVLGTYVFIEQSMVALANDLESLLTVIKQDRTERSDSIPLSFGFSKVQQDSIELNIINSRKEFSSITNRPYTVWTGEPKKVKVPHIKMDDPVEITKIPKAYYIPVEWSEVIEKLKMHGFEMETFKEKQEIELYQYLINDYEIDPNPSEGRIRFKHFNLIQTAGNMVFHAGSVKLSTDQPLGTLLTLLMEPRAPDSFFQWGFFHSILSRTEYIEPYALEPMVMQMIKNDVDLRLHYENKKRTDPEFSKNPRTILQWFYAQTPYFDKKWKLIPIGMEY